MFTHRIERKCLFKFEQECITWENDGDGYEWAKGL